MSVVIGAGPAGCAAAKRCAERGLKTSLCQPGPVLVAVPVGLVRRNGGGIS